MDRRTAHRPGGTGHQEDIMSKTNTLAIPERKSTELLKKWCEEFCFGDHDGSEPRRNKLHWMSDAYLGMCRHSVFGPDWLAHNHFFCAMYDELRLMVGEEKMVVVYRRVKEDIKATYGCEANY